MMLKATNSILIVGGGTAGWLTAAILAAKHSQGRGQGPSGITVTVIEAPDIPTVGVGEGTWPSMRATLQSVGIDEAEFAKACGVSFKQGSKFVGWKDGLADDVYYHPFSLPEGFYDGNLAQAWVNAQPKETFAKWASFQEILCEKNLSPKLLSSAQYSGIANYGYHLDAGKFAEFLKCHCVKKLGVKFIADKVTGVVSGDNGDIAQVLTCTQGPIFADLYVDCTGFSSLLIGGHYGIRFIDKSDVLPINSAVATHMPYKGAEPVASATISTAQEAGWIWDIGLAHRRGVGHVFCDSYISKDEAVDQLRGYLGLSEGELCGLRLNEITIKPGYREEFWHKNCVAIGLSAGFLEPLEASAMMLIEVAANMIAEQLPANREAMSVVAARFNRRCHYRWSRIIDFLKLHYILSKRAQPFWHDVASTDNISDRLREDLTLWRHQPPWKTDFDSLEEAFPAASYQYVLYGMGFETLPNFNMGTPSFNDFLQATGAALARKVDSVLPKVLPNRELLALMQ